MSNYDWMEEARALAAQCWCDKETEHLIMDTPLCEAVARRIAAWMQTGAQHARNEEYWRERALKAEASLPAAEEDARDAKRYRFLRYADLDAVAAVHWPNSDVPEGEEFDRAIDAAMSQDSKEGK